MKLILDVFLFPGNRVSDAVGLRDPGERGAMGIFVNALVWMMVLIVIFSGTYYAVLR